MKNFCHTGVDKCVRGSAHEEFSQDFKGHRQGGEEEVVVVEEEVVVVEDGEKYPPGYEVVEQQRKHASTQARTHARPHTLHVRYG